MSEEQSLVATSEAQSPSVLEQLREIADEGLWGIHGFTSFKTEDGQEVVTYENMVAALDAAAWIECVALRLLALVEAARKQSGHNRDEECCELCDALAAFDQPCHEDTQDAATAAATPKDSPETVPE